MKLINLLKIGTTDPMRERRFYRDGLDEVIIGPIRVTTTSGGHTIERYKLKSGKRRYFVTLAGTHWCAHGDSIANAVADALWKDPSRRPSMEALREDIKARGRAHKFTLNEFRLLTGACLTGCRSALIQAGKDEAPMTANDIRDVVSFEWGNKLISVLGWNEVTS